MKVRPVLLVAYNSLGLTMLDSGTIDFGSEGEIQIVVVSGDDADVFLSVSECWERYLL